MREILFRGIPKKYANMPEREKDWVLGSYLFIRSGDRHYIATGEVFFGTLNPVKVEVDPETIGQFTGKTDQNDSMLFEHDLVYYFDSNHDEEDGVGQILWDDEEARFIIVFDGLTIDFDNCSSYQLEKVGNIHDNPELLGVSE